MRKTGISNSQLFFLFLLTLLVGNPRDAITQNPESKPASVAQSFWMFSLEWQKYQSFSQQDNNFPMKAGYPAFVALHPTFRVGYHHFKGKSQHALQLRLSAPTCLDSENGSGDNLLLEKINSTYFRSGLDYRWSFPLFSFKRLQLRHAVLSGLLFEKRNLNYRSGANEKTVDINLYLGPGFALGYPLSSAWRLEGRFDARFYLPYFNYGKLKTGSIDGETIINTAYHGFYYQAIFRLGATYQTPQSGSMHFGIRKNDLVGFANRAPSFEVDDLVHFKLDRLLQLYLSYRF